MFESATNKEKLSNIVTLFGNVKSIIIYAEEIAADFDTYPQILLELRNSLDHLLRAISAEIKPDGNEKNYVETNLDKAYAHLFRAAYDALDWSGVTIREQITEDLKPFSPRTISKAIPDYYPTMRPKIDEINTKISEIRNAKDIASTQDNLESFGEYLGYIETLRSYHKTITNAQSSLIEIEGDSKGTSRRFWIGTFAITLTGVVLAAIITYFLTR